MSASIFPNGCVILCPGQGAQVVGMGKVWRDTSHAARAIYDQADALLGASLGSPLSTLSFVGPVESLNRTDVSQPAIFVASMACWAGLLEQAHANVVQAGDSIVAAAGLSLGEYTALTIAGRLDFTDALRLVALRGRAMQEAAERGDKGGMLALIGASDEQAQQVCDNARGADVLVCANFNAPGQVVLSGHVAACERGAKVAEGMGLRSAMLQVAGAFHSPLMAPAAARLADALEQTTILERGAAVVSNVTALPYPMKGSTIRAGLVAQLTSPVKWSQSCAWLCQNHAQAMQAAHELAPGRTLAGLMRRIDKSAKVTSHDAPDAGT